MFVVCDSLQGAVQRGGVSVHVCLRIKLAVFSAGLLLVVTLNHPPEVEMCGKFFHRFHTSVSLIMKHTCDSGLVFNYISLTHV